MLEKKDVVQKSFRIHKQNDIWLGLLSAKLGRTQNELVNIAIKLLLEDNKEWFFDEFIIARFNDAINRDAKCVKVRIEDTEVEVIPYTLNDEKKTYLNIVYYENSSSDCVVGEETKIVDYSPGYESRLRKALEEAFESMYANNPRVMKDFSPGGSLEEF